MCRDRWAEEAKKELAEKGGLIEDERGLKVGDVVDDGMEIHENWGNAPSEKETSSAYVGSCPFCKEPLDDNDYGAGLCPRCRRKLR